MNEFVAAPRPASTLLLHGYSPLGPEAIVAALGKGSDISSLTGDFVVFDPSPTTGFAISSFVSALPYYWALSSDGHLFQGNNVFDVARRAKIDWQWNLQAIRSLALYGHTLNDDTICKGVYRIPPASRLAINGGQVSLEGLAVPAFRWDVEETEEQAFIQLGQSFQDCLQDATEVHLSLSAGYDSRLLLALCLDGGVRPNVSVMGHDESTDVVIAREICKRVGVPLQVIEVRQEDYLTLGSTIAQVTSGVKTAANWHTYLYHKGKDFSGGIHFVGSNGEFARSFYCDAPRFRALAERMPASTLRAYWFAKCSRRFFKFSRANPLLTWGNGLAPLAMARRAGIDRRWGAEGFLSAMDAFYAEQRVRHFIGSGLACYAAHGAPRSPFLCPRWMRTVAALGRSYKHSDLYHATCIRRLNRSLAEFNYNRLPTDLPGKSYHPFNRLAMSSIVEDLLMESTFLDHWLSRGERLAILQDQHCSQVEERNFWLTLHFASEALSGGQTKATR